MVAQCEICRWELVTDYPQVAFNNAHIHWINTGHEVICR